MLIRYVELKERYNRDEPNFLQAETVEDYAERVKAIKEIRFIMCKDGLEREIFDISYIPPKDDNYVPCIDVYLEPVE